MRTVEILEPCAYCPYLVDILPRMNAGEEVKTMFH